MIEGEKIMEDLVILQKMRKLLKLYGANEQEVDNFIQDLLDMQDEPTDEQKINQVFGIKEKQKNGVE